MKQTLLIEGGLLPEDLHSASLSYLQGLFTPLVAPLVAPTLLQFLQRGQAQPGCLSDDTRDTLRCTASEAWLAHQFSLPTYLGWQPSEGIPYAVWANQSQAHQGLFVARCDPVHLELGRDSLTLADPAQLTITTAEAHALLAAIAPLLDAEDLHIEINPDRPGEWLLQGELAVRAATMAAVVGQNIDGWFPQNAATGSDARRWRRILNEIQMTWHDHPVNQARSAQGQPVINSVWLHGGAHHASTSTEEPLTSHPTSPLMSPYCQIVGDHPWVHTLQAITEPQVGAEQHLILENRLANAHATQDWGRWQQAWPGLIEEHLVPALALLKCGALSEFSLVLCHRTQWHQINLSRWRAKQFWRSWGWGEQRTLATLKAHLIEKPYD